MRRVSYLLKLEKLKTPRIHKMKRINLFCLTATCVFLAACAMTPEQKAERAQEKAKKRLALQVQMAQQCDPVAAKLMSQLPTISQLPPAQRTQFDQQYEARVNNPTFQSCYNMAFKAYNEQQQLNLAELEWDTDAGWFNNSPFNCEFPRPEGPFWRAC